MEYIWSDHNKYKNWIIIEIQLLHALQHVGVIDSKLSLPTILINDTQNHMELLIEGTGSMLARQIFFPTFIEDCVKEENKTKHDVAAFVHVLEECMPNDVSRYIHYGITSSDLCDTDFAMKIDTSIEFITEEVMIITNILKQMAIRYQYSPIIGRTHGMYAEPTSFGLVLLSYVAEFKRHLERLKQLRPRVCVGKLSGAVGTYAHIEPAVEEFVMKRCGVGIETVSTQVVSRDRHAELFNAIALIGSTLERLAIEIRHLSRSEVKEVAEPFGKKQKGSSAMPHKKNPIQSENITGLARLLKHYAGAAMDNIPLWHQRDISHSSVERIIAPDAFGILYFILNRMTNVIKDLYVDEAKMLERVKENTEWVSQTIMLELIDGGMSRKDAHNKVQHGELRPYVQSEMIDHHLHYIPDIFSRVL